MHRFAVTVFVTITIFALVGVESGFVLLAEEKISQPVSSILKPEEPVREDTNNEYAGIVYAVRFSPDGKVLATGWGDGKIRIWEVETGKNTADFVTPVNVNNLKERFLIRSIAFSPDGKTLASTHDGSISGGFIRLWNMTSGQYIAVFNGRPNNRLQSGIYCVVYSPDGKMLATGHEDNLIRVWDAANFELIKAFEADGDDRGYAVAFSPDGKRLASGGPGGEIHIWDLIAGEKRATFKAVDAGNSVYSLAYHPNGKTLGAGCWMQGGGMLWDVEKGVNTAKLKPDDVDSEAINKINDMTYSVAFSPDGKTFAQGCANGMIVLWKIDSREVTAVLNGHADTVRSLDFSPDGTTLASGSTDSTVRLWTMK